MSKCLSIQEPYASLLLMGLKHYETRSWATNYRGELYIQVPAKEFEGWRKNNLLSKIFKGKVFKKSCLLFKCCLTDCVPAETITDKKERKLGFYDSGRYAWKLENIVPVETIPLKGKLGIFNI